MHVKTLILSGCLPLLFVTGLRAQSSSPKPPSTKPSCRSQSPWSISASVGAAFPVGKFAGRNFDDSTQSFAIMGLALNLELHCRLCAHFGIDLSLSGQDNHVATRSMEEQIQQEDHANAVAINSGAWKIGKIMVGPTLSLPIGRDGEWEFNARLMAGGLKTAEPQIKKAEESSIPAGPGPGSLPGVEQSYSFLGKKGLSWALAYLGGAGIGYKIDKRWKLRLDIDYAAASVKVPYLYYRHHIPGTGLVGVTFLPGLTVIPGPPPSNNLYLPIASVNATAGLEFRF